MNNRVEIVKRYKKKLFIFNWNASVNEIEKLNILQASLMVSMKRAIISLSKKPDLVLIDGIFAPKITIELQDCDQR